MRVIPAQSRSRRRHVRKPQRRPRLGPSSPSLRSVPSHSRLQVPLQSSDAEMDDEDEVGSQIDSMSARLAKLVEDGQRALGTEIVISSESQEDELDDGMGQWVEDDESQYTPSKSIYEDSDQMLHLMPTGLLSPPRPGLINPSPPGSFPFN